MLLAYCIVCGYHDSGVTARMAKRQAEPQFRNSLQRMIVPEAQRNGTLADANGQHPIESSGFAYIFEPARSLLLSNDSLRAIPQASVPQTPHIEYKANPIRDDLRAVIEIDDPEIMSRKAL